MTIEIGSAVASTNSGVDVCTDGSMAPPLLRSGFKYRWHGGDLGSTIVPSNWLGLLHAAPAVILTTGATKRAVKAAPFGYAQVSHGAGVTCTPIRVTETLFTAAARLFSDGELFSSPGTPFADTPDWEIAERCHEDEIFAGFWRRHLSATLASDSNTSANDICMQPGDALATGRFHPNAEKELARIQEVLEAWHGTEVTRFGPALLAVLTLDLAHDNDEPSLRVRVFKCPDTHCWICELALLGNSLILLCEEPGDGPRDAFTAACQFKFGRYTIAQSFNLFVEPVRVTGFSAVG